MNWLEITAQISQVAGVISVVFAAIAIRSNTKLSQRQWNVDTFTTYSERHKAAIAAFPDNAFYNRLDPEKLPPRSSELTQAVLNYLFVLCDVHYLAYHKYLDDSIWNAWREENASHGGLMLEKAENRIVDAYSHEKQHVWISGEPLVDRKSTFVAHICRVVTERDVHEALHQLLDRNSKLQRATHNMVRKYA